MGKIMNEFGKLLGKIFPEGPKKAPPEQKEFRRGEKHKNRDLGLGRFRQRQDGRLENELAVLDLNRQGAVLRNDIA